METQMTNAVILAVLLAVMPMLVELLKAFAWTERNKRWFGPLLCIVLATAAAYWRQVDMWLFVGIVTGMAAAKSYDFYGCIKDNISGPAGGAGIVLLLVLLPVVLLGGCTKCWMAADFKAEVEAQNILVQSLNRACQTGDALACRAGLSEAAKTMQLIVYETNGVDPNGK